MTTHLLLRELWIKTSKAFRYLGRERVETLLEQNMNLILPCTGDLGSNLQEED